MSIEFVVNLRDQTVVTVKALSSQWEELSKKMPEDSDAQLICEETEAALDEFLDGMRDFYGLEDELDEREANNN